MRLARCHLGHRNPDGGRDTIPIMIGFRVTRLLAVAPLVAVVTACSSSGSGPASSPATSQRPSASSVSSSSPPSAPPSASAKPVGIVAIGHSGLTGQNSNPNAHYQDAKQNSWATGTNPAVDSIYLRLVAANPATEGHVANAAVGGTDVTALKGQAATALALVPNPQLVIIQTTDNDIKCDGSDKANVAAYGATLKETLQSITDATPQSTILIEGGFSHPDIAFTKKFVAANPDSKTFMSGNGICDSYDPAGHLLPKNFDTLTAIIKAYEAEGAKVCAKFANCHWAGSLRPAYVDELGTYTDDWNHLNVKGLTGYAALEWPVVAKLLNLT